MSIKTTIGLILLVLVCFVLFGVKTKASREDNYSYNYVPINNKYQIYDPYESFNRKIFFVNGVLDSYILRPIAVNYACFTNDYIKARIGNFIDNISEPLSTINYGIQGNPEAVFKTFWRFIINSTFGVAGIFDVASKLDLIVKPQTFASTLGHYGVGPGPYIVIPIYGGMGLRDVIDPLLFNSYINPVKYFMHRNFKFMLAGTNIVYDRAQIMPFSEHVSKNFPDPYVVTRDAVLNRRETKMEYPVNFVYPSGNDK